jgi:hypothetical protein
MRLRAKSFSSLADSELYTLVYLQADLTSCASQAESIAIAIEDRPCEVRASPFSQHALVQFCSSK